MQRIERGARSFPFLAVLDGIFDALYAGRTFALHRFGRYAAKPQKVTRSRALAALCRESWDGVTHTRRLSVIALHRKGI